MKKFIGVQLALFFVSACMLYLYASSMLATEYKSKFDMTSEDADTIWAAVNNLEDAWPLAGMPVEKEMKGKADAAKRVLVEVQPLYEELNPIIAKLIKAYDKHEDDKFNMQKMKIAAFLSPVWKTTGDEAKEKEQKERVSSLSWLARMRENLRQRMNEIYYYFFGSQKKGLIEKRANKQQPRARV